MSLRIERIPTFGDNYTYLIVCEKTGEAAVVDAPEDEPVFRRVDSVGAKVVKILSTHHHPDHSMAGRKLGASSRARSAAANASSTRPALT